MAWALGSSQACWDVPVLSLDIQARQADCLGESYHKMNSVHTIREIWL